MKENEGTEKKLRTEIPEKVSLKERILGKWKIVKFTDSGPNEPMEVYHFSTGSCEISQ